MRNELPWQEHLFCNGDRFAEEKSWLTPNTYCLNFASPPARPGVYLFVVYTSPGDFGNIVYIGSSQNIALRYRGHPVKGHLYMNYWYVRFYFQPCENPKDIEKALIKKWKPKFNIQHNSRSLHRIQNGIID